MNDSNIGAMLMALRYNRNRHMMGLFLCTARLSFRQIPRSSFGAIGLTALVSRGWDPNGPMRPLHRMNPRASPGPPPISWPATSIKSLAREA